VSDRELPGYEPDYGYLRVGFLVDGKRRSIWGKCVRRTDKVVVFIKVDTNGEPFITYNEKTNVETTTKHLFVCKPEHVVFEREARVSLKYGELEVVG
jgi:hypothetical protein